PRSTSDKSSLSLHDALPILVGEVVEEDQLRVGLAAPMGPHRQHRPPRPVRRPPARHEVPPPRPVADAILAGRLGHQHVGDVVALDRKSTRLNSSHVKISYAV